MILPSATITEISKKKRLFFKKYIWFSLKYLSFYYFTELEPRPTVRSILDGTDWKSSYSLWYEEAFAVCRVCSSISSCRVDVLWLNGPLQFANAHLQVELIVPECRIFWRKQCWKKSRTLRAALCRSAWCWCGCKIAHQLFPLILLDIVSNQR